MAMAMAAVGCDHNLLHTCRVQERRATLNRIHMSLHFTATLALISYRISHLVRGDVPNVLAWSLITFSELIFTFIWILTQAFRWRPVNRSVNLEKLPTTTTSYFPGVDVFICTSKEPVVQVMNTVLSAMSLDYPPEKLSVYLSDDGGSAATLYAIKEACSFAKSSWIPFCKKYNIKTRCPEAYFSSTSDDNYAHLDWSDDLMQEEQNIKLSYDMFKKNVEKVSKIEDSSVRQHDRPPHVEIIHDNKNGETKLPLLVYMSREKRPSYPHRFKAGALNALLRVSGIMSNGPYILVLDSDTYCNDPISAKQAMCFFLDPYFSPSLSYVQFPQIFYNINNNINDIYDAQARSAYRTKYQGMDGLSGTVCSGTGYYLNKKALYSSPPNHQDELMVDEEKKFGYSRLFNDSLKSLYQKNVNNLQKEGIIISNAIVEEAKSLATCSFEQNTRWGKDIGYSYECLLESTFTGYLMHCKGWKSVYLYPKRPSFLGCATIDMKDAMVQLMKWASSLVQVGFSRFSPLTYGMINSSSNMSILQSMCYAYFSFTHFFSISCLLYAIIPQLCFLKGISLFPEIYSGWFMVFGGIYISSLGQHLYEVISSGGSVLTWWNEQRIWMIKSVTACLFGCLEVLFRGLMGVRKADHANQEKMQEKGKFDFHGATNLFMIPLTFLVVLNLVCFFGGLKGMISNGSFQHMFGQFFLSSYILVLSLPILEGLVSKKAKKKK